VRKERKGVPVFFAAIAVHSDHCDTKKITKFSLVRQGWFEYLLAKRLNVVFNTSQDFDF
jgi:hypothetical protein